MKIAGFSKSVMIQQLIQWYGLAEHTKRRLNTSQTMEPQEITFGSKSGTLKF